MRFHPDYIIFEKNNKKGGYFLQLHDDSLRPSYYLPPIFDSIGKTPDRNRSNWLTAYKQDSIFTYNMPTGTPFRYNKSFGEVYLMKKNGKRKQIGYEGRFTKETGDAKLSDMFFNGLWLGVNLNSRDYKDIHNGKNFTSNSAAIDVGFGKYFYIGDKALFPAYSFLFGGGMGLEYRVPEMNKTDLQSRIGMSYRPLYLNTRFELGASFLYFINIHLQLGHTTDFVYHYLRPGIGFSFGALQVGYENFIKIGKQSQGLPMSGYYARYIVLF